MFLVTCVESITTSIVWNLSLSLETYFLGGICPTVLNNFISAPRYSNLFFTLCESIMGFSFFMLRS